MSYIIVALVAAVVGGILDADKLAEFVLNKFGTAVTTGVKVGATLALGAVTFLLGAPVLVAGAVVFGVGVLGAVSKGARNALADLQNASAKATDKVSKSI